MHLGNRFQEFYRGALVDAVEMKLRVIVLVLDSQGVIVQANRFAHAILGAVVEGRKFADTVLAFDAPFDLSAFCAHAKSERRLLSLSTAAGLPRSFFVTCTRYAEDDGDRTLIVAEEDVDDAEMLKKNLIETNGELSNLTRQYQKANAELTKLNQQKNHFLGIAAHDLRNPLASIIAFCDFLVDDADVADEERRLFLESIQTASRYMLGLLEELLDITRIEAGKLDLNIRPTDPYDVVRWCVDLNRPLAERKGISMTLSSHESLPIVEMDRRKVEQVLNNLLSNAIKYSHPETTVSVTVFVTDADVVVSVADQGIGIAEKDIDQVFRPFNRVSHEGTAGETSTGLGLAIVQRIVIGHGGRIWLESAEGKGTTFYFSLPLAERSE